MAAGVAGRRDRHQPARDIQRYRAVERFGVGHWLAFPEQDVMQAQAAQAAQDEPGPARLEDVRQDAGPGDHLSDVPLG